MRTSPATEDFSLSRPNIEPRNRAIRGRLGRIGLTDPTHCLKEAVVYRGVPSLQAMQPRIEHECCATVASMTKGKASALGDRNAGLLDRIKILAVQAMFSDDDLLEKLVLKGGNAMALVHRVSARSSVDLDFSLEQDFGDDISGVRTRIEHLLSETFAADALHLFDFEMIEKPKTVSDDMKNFWGGYEVVFKLATSAVYVEHGKNQDELRKRALNLGRGTRFSIDISRFEYIDDKEAADLGGYTIYVYSPVMIVCEKLRAICQQMPEYGPVIKRARPGSARPRDFIDIFVLMTKLQLDLDSPKAHEILRSMFAVKKVPLNFLGKVSETYDMHVAGFPSVQDTVDPGFDLRDFRFYFEYTLELIDQLKPLWDV